MKSQVFRNPIIPGFAPDPSVVRVDGIFYLVTSSFHIWPGLPVYASKDLQHWRLIGSAINRADQLSLSGATTKVMPLNGDRTMVATAGLFAPTIRYHRGTFYIVCTNTTYDKDRLQTENFIISTTDIWSSNWSNPIYFTFNGIDPSLFFDDDGRTYIQGSWIINRLHQPSCTIKQLEIDLLSGTALSEPYEIWKGSAQCDTEGPHIYKRGAWYYLLVAEGGTFEHHMLSVARARNVWGPYESFAQNPVLTADGTSEYIQNVGHGDLFEDDCGTWWAIVLGVRNVSGRAPLGRESFLTAVDWPIEGWPTISQPVVNFSRPAAGWFHADSLDQEEATFRRTERVFVREAGPNHHLLEPSPPELVELTTTSNMLSSEDGPIAFYGERQRSLHARATVWLDTPTRVRSTVAGLALYLDALRHVTLGYNFDSNHIEFVSHTETESGMEKIYCSIAPNITGLNLKIEASPNEYVFAFMPPKCAKAEQKWQVVGRVATHSLAARGFTGPLLGAFAYTTHRDAHAQTCVFRDLLISISEPN